MYILKDIYTPYTLYSGGCIQSVHSVFWEVFIIGTQCTLQTLRVRRMRTCVYSVFWRVCTICIRCILEDVNNRYTVYTAYSEGCAEFVHAYTVYSRGYVQSVKAFKVYSGECI